MAIQTRTGIIPFSYYYRKQSGSTILRAEGLANTTTDFEIWKHGHQYDNLIFQKVYWNEMMKQFKGPKILDLCDPDWINGTFDIKETGELADAITCSSAMLTDLVKTYFPKKPVIHVPDRLDFNTFPQAKKSHEGKAARLIWFGYINNAHETLTQLASCIKKHQLKLTIIADLPYSNEDEILALNPEFIYYSQHTVHPQIQEGDIVLNPKSDKGFFKYKSNNKTIISWKLGLPVAETADDLEKLLDPVERNKEVAKNKYLVDQDYNILKSAVQYREIITMIKKL